MFPSFLSLLFCIIINKINKASPLTFLQVYDTTTLLHSHYNKLDLNSHEYHDIPPLYESHNPQKHIINMSPIIARAAMRSAAAAATTSSRVAVPRRNFSIIQSLRTFGRSLESHPFERLPVTAKSASADWGRQLKRTGKQAVMYVSIHHL